MTDRSLHRDRLLAFTRPSDNSTHLFVSKDFCSVHRPHLGIEPYNFYAWRARRVQESFRRLRVHANGGLQLQLNDLIIRVAQNPR